MSFRIRSDLGYLTALAVVSVLILILGVVFRPHDAPAPVISEAERVQLQNLAQRQSLQRRTVVLAGYARDLSVTAARVLQQPETVPYIEPRPGEMLIIVSVVDSGDPQWITVEFAGHNPVRCGGEPLAEISVDSVIPPSLARAAVFTLGENLVGAVTRCEDRLIVTDPKNYAAALRVAAEQRYMRCCGVRFADDSSGGSGKIVTELKVGSLFDRAHVEVGDRILSVNGQTFTSDEFLRHLIAAPQVAIDVERSDRKITLRYEKRPIGSGALLQRAREGTRVAEVEEGTPAALRGLKEGDIVNRAGEVRSPTPAALEKMLSASDSGAMVVTRGDRRILLEPPQ